LRISSDANIPGLARLVEGVREASEGHTRLIIQIIDFLNIPVGATNRKFIRETGIKKSYGDD
jgi:hypothetical protein